MHQRSGAIKPTNSKSIGAIKWISSGKQFPLLLSPEVAPERTRTAGLQSYFWNHDGSLICRLIWTAGQLAWMIITNRPGSRRRWWYMCDMTPACLYSSYSYLPNITPSIRLPVPYLWDGPDQSPISFGIADHFRADILCTLSFIAVGIRPWGGSHGRMDHFWQD